eukprot:1779578-Pyramimonas_sp.AAC.1
MLSSCCRVAEALCHGHHALQLILRQGISRLERLGSRLQGWRPFSPCPKALLGVHDVWPRRLAVLAKPM